MESTVRTLSPFLLSAILPAVWCDCSTAAVLPVSWPAVHYSSACCGTGITLPHFHPERKRIREPPRTIIQPQYCQRTTCADAAGTLALACQARFER